MICFLEETDFFFGDLSEDTDSETRSRERMATQERAVESEFTTDLSDFIFEEEAEGFDKRHVHFFRESADIVMRLDGHGRTMDRHRFDHIRIDRPLSEETDVVHFCCSFLKEIDEELSNYFTFPFRITDSR